MNNYNKNQRGFTLVEILVATSIFVTATVLVTDIFVRTNKVQRKTQGIQTTATDARFAFETIVREARLGEIDYSYYSSGTVSVDTGETVLALTTATQDKVRFGLRNDVCPVGSTKCLAVCLVDTCTSSNWTAITPQGVNVTKLKFYIYPDKDPFVVTGSTFNNNFQPRVTISMTTENITTDAVSKATFTMQTTVSSRVYKR